MTSMAACRTTSVSADQQYPVTPHSRCCWELAVRTRDYCNLPDEAALSWSVVVPNAVNSNIRPPWTALDLT